MKYRFVSLAMIHFLLKIVSSYRHPTLLYPIQTFYTTPNIPFSTSINKKCCIYSKKNKEKEYFEDEMNHEINHTEDDTTEYSEITEPRTKRQRRLERKNACIHTEPPQPTERKYTPKSHNQQLYMNYLMDQAVKIVVGTGAAGTGKTLFACQEAIQKFKQGEVQKIIITRPLVSVEQEDIGFLPGTLENKMDPWTRPIFDIFREYYSKTEIEKMMYNNIIEISPLAYMRGRTFKYSWIIADEMQNSSPNQMLMMTTRLGIGSKLVITGDLQQSDKMPYSKTPYSKPPPYNPNHNTEYYDTKHIQPYLYQPQSVLNNLHTRPYTPPNTYKYFPQKTVLSNTPEKPPQSTSGLEDFIDKCNYYGFYNEMQDIKIVYMDASDVRRSSIVTKILNIYKDSTP